MTDKTEACAFTSFMKIIFRLQLHKMSNEREGRVDASIDCYTVRGCDQV